MVSEEEINEIIFDLLTSSCLDRYTRMVKKHAYYIMENYDLDEELMIESIKNDEHHSPVYFYILYAIDSKKFKEAAGLSLKSKSLLFKSFNRKIRGYIETDAYTFFELTKEEIIEVDKRRSKVV